MGFGNCVLVNDTLANLEVIGSAGLSFNGKIGCSDLCDRINYLLDHPEIVIDLRNKAQERINKHFSWDKITQEYELLFEKLIKKEPI